MYTLKISLTFLNHPPISVSGEGTILKPDHRAAVFPILLKIMFGKMGSRIGHAKGKAGSKQRQGIVLRYLEVGRFCFYLRY